MKKIFLISMLLILLVVTPGDMFTQAQDASIFPANAPQEQMSLRDSHIRPAPVNNLAASTGQEPGTIILTWEAPGADGYEGTASAYIIRRSSEADPITAENWDTATLVPNPPTPQPAGSQEMMTISGLVPGQGYHFALKAQNDIPNTSYVSNNAFAAAGRIPLDYTTFIPFMVQTTSTETVIISDNTRVLSETTTQYLSEISEDGTLFTFSQSVPELLALQPGDIIVGDVAANAPDGFLRTVTSISTSGNQVVVNTTDATLEEVILEGSMSASGELVPEDTRSIELAPGVSMVPQDQARAEGSKNWRFELERVLYEDDDDDENKIEISGHLEIDLSYNFDYRFSWAKLQETSFTVTVKEDASLWIEGQYNSTLASGDVNIATVNFRPISFTIGIVPVVLTTGVEIYVGVNGEVSTYFITGVEQDFSYTGGAQWQRGVGWSTIKIGPSTNFDYKTPELEFDLSVKAYAGVKATLKLYGAVGPFVKAQGYLEFSADFNANPWWDLYTGFEVYAGFELKVLTLELSEDWKLLDYSKLLAQAPLNLPPFEPSNPTPVDGATDINRSISLHWSGGDPNPDDTVTYDVYFQEGTSSPGIRICEGITATTCKPCDQIPCQDDDVLKENTDYSWRVVATDWFGLTTEGPVWGFTTGTEWEIPETVKYSGCVYSKYPWEGYWLEGHDYPLYASVRFASGKLILGAYSDPFTGCFEIELPTTSVSYDVTITSIIEGHTTKTYEFAHGYRDSLDNEIDVNANLIEFPCAPGYVIGFPFVTDVPGCVPIPGGVVAGYVYTEKGKPVGGATVESDDVTVQTFGQYDIPKDPNSLGLYWLFQPTADDPQFVEFTASSGLFYRDIQTVEVFQSQINRQDFYLSFW